MINLIFILCLGFILINNSIAHGQSSDLDRQRKQLIVDALNKFPENWVMPITENQVRILSGQGRIDVNLSAKFSYYLQTPNALDPKSPMLLVPLATSRYAPTYYQTDTWWDAHKDEIDIAKRSGQTQPRQDAGEVATWLAANKLSTNPLVFEISPSTGKIQTWRLQEFLAEKIIREFAKDGFITLYRGGEKPGELASLKKGERPKGMRYWTPTANYAWRYARKNPAFLQQLINGEAPLFVFKMPVAEFRDLVTRGKYPDLTLGTELTKNAHTALERGGKFMDHLYQTEYSGVGNWGFEIELRSNSKGATEMTKHFSHAITIEELAADRIAVLQKSLARLSKQFPERELQLKSSTEERIAQVVAEERLLVSLRDLESEAQVLKGLETLPSRQWEMTLIDSVGLSSFVRAQLNNRSLGGSCRTVFTRAR